MLVSTQSNYLMAFNLIVDVAGCMPKKNEIVGGIEMAASFVSAIYCTCCFYQARRRTQSECRALSQKFIQKIAYLKGRLQGQENDELKANATNLCNSITDLLPYPRCQSPLLNEEVFNNYLNSLKLIRASLPQKGEKKIKEKKFTILKKMHPLAIHSLQIDYASKRNFFLIHLFLGMIRVLHPYGSLAVSAVDLSTCAFRQLKLKYA